MAPDSTRWAREKICLPVGDGVYRPVSLVTKVHNIQVIRVFPA